MSEMEQQQPQVRSSPYQAPMHQYGSAIILLTNPENELFKMELTFRSMKTDKDGNAIPTGEPLMNEFGVSSVIGTIQALVNQISIMSNLKSGEISNLTNYIGDTLARDLMMNKTAYGIKSATARDKIYFTALSTSFITLKRAFEEGDKRFWKGSVQEIRTSTDAGKKGGFMSNLNPWRT